MGNDKVAWSFLRQGPDKMVRTKISTESPEKDFEIGL